jgi:cyanophycinase-like exopeptidase
VGRLLVIMGSGETTPGMLGVHREILAALPQSPQCRLMDSPFAFQENADELVERISGYFSESLGQEIGRVSLPVRADELTLERALTEVRAADWVFAGPGSPSYARRCWVDTPMPDALAGVVAPGRTGALLFASAAAVTLGDWSLPVYEIYKVGVDPHWEPGLGLMSRILGWRCAVVPHYDNREGGTHDTRFCYVGGRRLARIEPELVDAFILGVDEHTALVIDLDERTARVAGRGSVTLRVAGVEDVLPTGTTLTIEEIERRIEALAGGEPVSVADTTGAGRGAALTPASEGDAASPAGSGDGPADAEGEPNPPASSADLARTVLAALDDDASEGRAALVELAERAEEASVAYSRGLAGQVVQALVDVRSASRQSGDWEASDRIREVLIEVGVEVRDSREGSTWEWA